MGRRSVATNSIQHATAAAASPHRRRSRSGGPRCRRRQPRPCGSGRESSRRLEIEAPASVERRRRLEVVVRSVGKRERESREDQREKQHVGPPFDALLYGARPRGVTRTRLGLARSSRSRGRHCRSTTRQERPGIGEHELPRDAASEIRREKDRKTSELLRFGHPPQRNRLEDRSDV